MIQNDPVQDKKSLTEFTPKEQKLYELLSKRDETGQLPKMLKGIVNVLKNSDNPVRFAHAANTIRCIADELINRKAKSIIPRSMLKEDDFAEVKKNFEEILKKSLAEIKNEEDREESNQQATRTFEQLKNVLLFGVRTKRHQLVDLVGARGSRIVPEQLQKAAEQLANNYSYFARVLHRHKEDEPDFEDNWIFFQDSLILVTSEFFDIAKDIEPFLRQDTISNERSK